MLATALSLTMTQILPPLKNNRLVILALLENFVLLPALTYFITTVLSLDESLKIGLIKLFTSA
jgi:predicted Na+-dependent transporter